MNLTLSTVSLHIKFCRYCSHDSGWEETKTKTDYTIWNLYEGSLWIDINGKTLSAAKGDVLFFHPGDTYRAYCKDDCCNFLVTFFSFDSGTHTNLLKTNNTAGIYSSPEIETFSDRFCEEYLGSYQTMLSPSLKLYASFFSFFAELSSFWGMQHCFHDTVTELPMLKIHQLLHYMEEHFTENIPVKDYASFMDMSEKYFINFFHTQTGKTPKQYLIDCRMQYALKLLADPENSLSSIASTLHFSDQYAFSKAFKRYYGESPGSLRTPSLIEN